MSQNVEFLIPISYADRIFVSFCSLFSLTFSRVHASWPSVSALSCRIACVTLSGGMLNNNFSKIDSRQETCHMTAAVCLDKPGCGWARRLRTCSSGASASARSRQFRFQALFTLSHVRNDRTVDIRQLFCPSLGRRLYPECVCCSSFRNSISYKKSNSILDFFSWTISKMACFYFLWF